MQTSSCKTKLRLVLKGASLDIEISPRKETPFYFFRLSELSGTFHMHSGCLSVRGHSISVANFLCI